MTNFDFLRQINKENKYLIINKFIDSIRSEFDFKEGYIDDCDFVDGKCIYYLIFKDSLLYPYKNNDYYVCCLNLPNSYIFNIAFVSNNDFTEAIFQSFLSSKIN